MTLTTVRLELLRHGPPHNQLLSPLTRYMSLCADHAAEGFQVPFEHQDLIARLRSLQYRASDDPFGDRSRTTRQMHLDEMARRMGSLLGCAAGLVAEVSRAPRGETNLLHLELVISASELALLPFEIANAPPGFPGAGGAMILQPELPLSLTRTARRGPAPAGAWSHEPPRILFVSAAPPGVGRIPEEEHLLALRQAIDPWVETYDTDDADERRRRVAEHLVVLRHATLPALERLCAEERFSHVHILAHGAPLEWSGQERFGIAFHDERSAGGLRIVRGEELATALRADRRGERHASPAVVTLAACDSGDVGSVVSAGASVAHAIHLAGVPLVVASQFPLSFAGSVLMAQVLYGGLLRGDDPRRVLATLRRKLFAQVPEAHDWASLVAYATFPEDFERRLAVHRLLRAKSCTTAALRDVDRLAPQRASDDGKDAAIKTYHRSREQILARLERGITWLGELAAADGQEVAEHTNAEGLLASVLKRKAQILWAPASDEDAVDAALPEIVATLAESRRRYHRAWREDPSAAWAYVQYLTLSVAVGSESDEVAYASLWTTAATLADCQVESGDEQERRWALSALAELYALAPVVAEIAGIDKSPPPGPDSRDRFTVLPIQGVEERAVEFAERLRAATLETEHRDVYAARHQMCRFADLFALPGSHLSSGRTGAEDTKRIAQRVAEVLDLEPSACRRP